MSHTAQITIKESGDLLVLSCTSCLVDTSHKILAAIGYEDRSEDYGPIWDRYLTLQCQGCQTVSFCLESCNAEDYDHDTQTIEPKFTQYPEPARSRPAMNFVHQLPESIYNIYHETLKALSNNQPILAGVGIRAIVEALCNDHAAAGHNLQQRIDNLAVGNIITRDAADILHQLRFMGNEAAHSVMAHTAKELGIAFGVVEHLLQGAYIIPKQAASLPKASP